MHLSIETRESVVGDSADWVTIRWSVFGSEADVREAEIFRFESGSVDQVDVDTLPQLTGKTWDELAGKAISRGFEMAPYPEKAQPMPFEDWCAAVRALLGPYQVRGAPYNRRSLWAHGLTPAEASASILETLGTEAEAAW